MQYSQIARSRLSTAAHKLINDGTWHPLQTTPWAWYRVWQNRIVQRANFVDEHEQESILPLLQLLEPLEKLSGATGFREVLDIQLADDDIEIRAPLGNANDRMDAVVSRLSGIARVYSMEGVLMAAVPVVGITAECLNDARTRLMEARLVFQEFVE